MSEEGEASVRPAPLVPPAGEAMAQGPAAAGGPVSAARADSAAEADGRVPAEVRKTLWFRSLVGVFVAFDLAIVGTAVRYFLKGTAVGWATGGGVLFVAVLFTVIIWLMAQGYGWQRTEPEPGTPIPQEVRRSRWWKAGLWWWGFWSLILTAGAVGLGLRHDWWEFGPAVAGALFSWVKLAIAASGQVPPDLPDG